MPILNREADIYPENLLDSEVATCQPWWAMYTLSRHEKKLMRQLTKLNLPFYAPIIERRYRSPNGRKRVSYEPLFGNYVFVCGDELTRYKTVSTGSVSRVMPVPQPLELVTDLRQIRSLIATDSPLSPESRLEPGQRVRIRSGSFAGYEGVIVRRDKEVRLQVNVRFMEQGVSVVIEDFQADPI
ncbi:transcription termination/antitermination NusG family protein [Aureliella helgolandensis]|uniref:Transcriptional activator RfaH n=1 Tax=Aureliella helgolandensis TaxID=2527968 RepID=A0A518GD93_9BACT|nr:transcription termination/antitermination NusG family protein [Aureliella helgolandensis]QDV26566.1 transcriptional activator RfaH [Aureliella helgolandensis]